MLVVAQTGGVIEHGLAPSIDSGLQLGDQLVAHAASSAIRWLKPSGSATRFPRSQINQLYSQESDPPPTKRGRGTKIGVLFGKPISAQNGTRFLLPRKFTRCR
ncbi:hypothetical protein D3C84_876140 [compost metagenome]